MLFESEMETSSIYIFFFQFIFSLFIIIIILFQAILDQRWDLPEVMCNLCPMVLNLSVNISIFSMTCISVDRYQVRFNVFLVFLGGKGL